jgi:hypothetical protein
MKHLLIAFAFALIATGAQAGDNSCYGPVDFGPEWTVVRTGVNNSPADDSICRFKTNSTHGKRILRICPHGSNCRLQLSIANKPSDHRVDNDMVTTITKWPTGGAHNE